MAQAKTLMPLITPSTMSFSSSGFSKRWSFELQQAATEILLYCFSWMGIRTPTDA